MQFQYRCGECDRTFPLSPAHMVCPHCSMGQSQADPLHGVLDVEVSGQVKGAFPILDLLPVPRRYFPPIPVGDTPLWTVPGLRHEFHQKHLFVKDDGSNPTASLKDRASYLVAAFAKQHGIKEIVLASTGNAASSMAGVGAAAGLDITIFLPKSAPQAKMAQALQYGAHLHLVDGNYDLAYDLSMEYSLTCGVLSRNTGFNPLTIEGKKTVSLELFKQLKRAPDVVFVSAGDGVILSGVYKGFLDLKQLGLIRDIPVVYAVQAEGSSALYRAWKSGRFDIQPSWTIADSICVDVPRNGFHALRRLKAHQGQVVTVSDSAILEAQKLLSSRAGLFAEPAGAAAMAGYVKVRETIDPVAWVVVLTTGNGLKDIPAALKVVDVPHHAIRDLRELNLNPAALAGTQGFEKS